ncbi:MULTISPECIES: MsnO8 family LLM class oxidoreductase [unclassified Pseudonocardia]|uniref:MsnO8 family LLM class oxidoreductase n=1 Tax=unclassified Pseudonocardia TaxID=2619320 RepID=UPI00201647C5|nr:MULTISPECIES: MsnO8 family LLM class oxidoreductase [unclassified Pseudonocardia]
MARVAPGVRLSLLDRSRTRAGEPDSAALRHTVDRARRAERSGYHRFWVAEHHAVPGIASGSPPVLMAAVAAATERIRVGSGGIMLPNHQPLVVAEQAATLAALYPGRIDVGLGRSPGFTEPVRRALRAADAGDDAFRAGVTELLAYLDGYRERAGAAAHLVVSADVLVGPPELAWPEAWALAAARTTGEFPPLEPPARDRRSTGRQRELVASALSRTVAGDEDTVAEHLDDLVERTGADELLVSSSTWDRDALAESDAALARLLGATRAAPGARR